MMREITLVLILYKKANLIEGANARSKRANPRSEEPTLGLRELIIYEGASSRSNSISDAV